MLTGPKQLLTKAISPMNSAAKPMEWFRTMQKIYINHLSASAAGYQLAIWSFHLTHSNIY